MRANLQKWRCVWSPNQNRWDWRFMQMQMQMQMQQQQRVLHEGPDTLEELLDRHLVQNNNNNNNKTDDDELENRRQLSSTRREALSLYRDIIRATRFFMWPDSKGVLWRDILRHNARTEFEQARFETDPQIVTRLIIGGRQALHSAIDKVADKHRQHIHKDNPHQR